VTNGFIVKCDRRGTEGSLWRVEITHYKAADTIHFAATFYTPHLFLGHAICYACISNDPLLPTDWNFYWLSYNEQ